MAATVEIQDLQAKLKNKGWNISSEGIAECMQTLGQVKYTAENLIKSAVNFDLKEIGSKVLTEDVKRGQAQSVEGPLVLQVQKVRNVSAPKANEESSTAPRLLKLQLSDGHTTCFALENSLIQQLSLSTPPGTKVRLKGSIPLFSGFLLLEPGHIEILGGKVEKLIAKWEANRSITQQVSRSGMASEGPPLFIAFDVKATNSSQKAPSEKYVQKTQESPLPSKNERDSGETGENFNPDLNQRTQSPRPETENRAPKPNEGSNVKRDGTGRGQSAGYKRTNEERRPFTSDGRNQMRQATGTFDSKQGTSQYRNDSSRQKDNIQRNNPSNKIFQDGRSTRVNEGQGGGGEKYDGRKKNYSKGSRNDDNYSDDVYSAPRSSQGTLWDFLESRFPTKENKSEKEQASDVAWEYQFSENDQSALKETEPAGQHRFREGDRRGDQRGDQWGNNRGDQIGKQRSGQMDQRREQREGQQVTLHGGQRGDQARDQPGEQRRYQRGDQRGNQHGHQRKDQQGNQQDNQRGDGGENQRGDQRGSHHNDQRKDQQGHQQDNQRGDQRESQRGDQRGNQHGHQRKDQQGNQRGNQRGDQRGNQYGDQRKDQQGNQQVNQRGDQRDNQRGDQRGNQHGDQRKDQQGNQQDNQRGDQRDIQRGDQRGNQHGEQRKDQQDNQQDNQRGDGGGNQRGDQRGNQYEIGDQRKDQQDNQRGDQRDNQRSDQRGNQHGDQRKDQQGNQQDNQRGDQRGNQHGDQRKDQQGNQRDNERADQKENERDNQRGNQKGNQQGDQRDNQRADQKGNQRNNQRGDQRGDQKENQQDNQRVDQRGNQRVDKKEQDNQRGDQRGNQRVDKKEQDNQRGDQRGNQRVDKKEQDNQRVDQRGNQRVDKKEQDNQRVDQRGNQRGDQKENQQDNQRVDHRGNQRVDKKEQDNQRGDQRGNQRGDQKENQQDNQRVDNRSNQRVDKKEQDNQRVDQRGNQRVDKKEQDNQRGDQRGNERGDQKENQQDNQPGNQRVDKKEQDNQRVDQRGNQRVDQKINQRDNQRVDQKGYQQDNQQGRRENQRDNQQDNPRDNQRGNQRDNQRDNQRGNQRDYQRENQRGYERGVQRGSEKANQRGYGYDDQKGNQLSQQRDDQRGNQRVGRLDDQREEPQGDMQSGSQQGSQSVHKRSGQRQDQRRNYGGRTDGTTDRQNTSTGPRGPNEQPNATKGSRHYQTDRNVQKDHIKANKSQGKEAGNPNFGKSEKGYPKSDGASKDLTVKTRDENVKSEDKLNTSKTIGREQTERSDRKVYDKKDGKDGSRDTRDARADSITNKRQQGSSGNLCDTSGSGKQDFSNKTLQGNKAGKGTVTNSRGGDKPFGNDPEISAGHENQEQSDDKVDENVKCDDAYVRRESGSDEKGHQGLFDTEAQSSEITVHSQEKHVENVKEDMRDAKTKDAYVGGAKERNVPPGFEQSRDDGKTASFCSSQGSTQVMYNQRRPGTQHWWKKGEDCMALCSVDRQYHLANILSVEVRLRSCVVFFPDTHTQETVQWSYLCPLNVPNYDGQAFSPLPPNVSASYFHPVSLPYPVPVIPSEWMNHATGSFLPYFSHEGQNMAANTRTSTVHDVYKNPTRKPPTRPTQTFYKPPSRS